MNKLFLLSIATLAAAPLAIAHSPAGTPKNFCESPFDWTEHDYVPFAFPQGFSVILQTTFMDGNQAGDCNGDTIPFDFDGHSEYALHGAILLTPVTATGGLGALGCYGETGHHPAAGPIAVGAALVAFAGADYTPPCGDFLDDAIVPCVPTCIPPVPGTDGAHHVYVLAGPPDHVTS